MIRNQPSKYVTVVTKTTPVAGPKGPAWWQDL